MHAAYPPFTWVPRQVWRAPVPGVEHPNFLYYFNPSIYGICSCHGHPLNFGPPLEVVIRLSKSVISLYRGPAPETSRYITFLVTSPLEIFYGVENELGGG